VIDGLPCCNARVRVEACTTLVEDFAGRLSLLRWTETQAVLVGTTSHPLLHGLDAAEQAA
jgi:hypothetical protein